MADIPAQQEGAADEMEKWLEALGLLALLRKVKSATTFTAAEEILARIRGGPLRDHLLRTVLQARGGAVGLDDLALVERFHQEMDAELELFRENWRNGINRGGLGRGPTAVETANDMGRYVEGKTRELFYSSGYRDHAGPVRRILNPADHCATCPPKQGIYPSFSEMRRRVGVPGDGSDDCFFNCRCSVAPG